MAARPREFTIYDTATNGNLVAGPLTNSATGVANGLFAVTLDFGSGVFTGPARWLQLDVRTNGPGSPGFTTLAPRQQILPTPYAIMANTASNLLGTLPLSQLGPGNANITVVNGVVTTGTYADPTWITALAGSKITGNISGNAATATTAVNVTGNISDSQLSTNIARLNGTNNFVGTNNFLGVTVATNANNVFKGSFTGNGAGLTNLNVAQVPAGVLTNNQSGVAFSGLTTVSNLSVTATNFVNYLVVSNPPALNGSAITNLNAAQLAGTLALAQLPAAVVTNGTTGVTLTGTFSGSGAGLTGVSGTVTWQNVTGTSQQAQPNTGYLANNAAQVTITLPTNPNVGDIVGVSGVGAGGWQIVQSIVGNYSNQFPFTGSETNITLNPGAYDIKTYGAQGGDGYGSSSGVGAEMEARFFFPTSITLTVLVGGRGGGFNSGDVNGDSGGGGGGSFVVNGSTPLVIAGGGGGGGYNGANGGAGITNSAGSAGSGGGGSGGTSGGGGGGSSTGSDGGGGGFNSNGGTGPYGSGGGGSSYLSGGAGGSGVDGRGDYGGFGGGGGGGSAGGGGGGYSGGGGGGGTSGGGGGGSLIDSSAIQIVTELNGVQSGNGEVDIVQIPTSVTQFAGGQNSAIELQYIGNGQWQPLNLITPTIANYLLSYSTTTQAVHTASTFQDITNQVDAQISGWKHTVGTTTFTNAQTGLYLIEYTAIATVTSSTATTITLIAVLNGTEIADSQSTAVANTANQTVPISKSFIANFNTGDVLKFQFTGSGTIGRIVSNTGLGTTRPSFSCTIIRLQ